MTVIKQWVGEMSINEIEEEIEWIIRFPSLRDAYLPIMIDEHLKRMEDEYEEA
jgi:hypothetical protein